MKVLPTHNKFSAYILFLLLALVSLQHLRFNTWDNQPKAESFHWDNFGYYLYLPAIIENGDLETLEITRNYFDAVQPSPNFYQVKQTETLNKPMIVYPMGMAYFYAIPYVGTKAIMTLVYDDYSSFDRPFHVIIVLWSLLFVFFSLFLLRRILLRFFSDKIAGLALLLLILGTNSFFYMAYFPQIVHPILFGFYVLFLYLCIQWHEKPNWKNGLWLGLCFSLCTLIRPSSFFLIPLFLFWDLNGHNGLWGKLKWIFSQYRSLLVLVVSGLVLSIPQLLYWKMQSGDYLYFSYAVDWFDFTQPQLWKGIFGTRTGWAFHHPLILVCLLGLFALIKSKTQYGLAIFIAAIVQIWFVLSWSNYWYGSGFGHRGFTEFQALLIFPLAFLLDLIFKAKIWVKAPALVLVGFLAFIGVLRIAQYDNGIWGMPNISPQYAKENYLASSSEQVDFSLLYTSEEGDEVLRNKLASSPQLFDAYYSYSQDFSFLNHPNVRRVDDKSGKAFEFNAETAFNPTTRLPYITLDQKPGSGVELSVNIKNLGGNTNKKAFLVFEVSDAKNETKYFYSSTPIDFNQVSPDKGWLRISEIKDLPDLRFKDDIYSIYLYNPEGCRFLADDIQIRSLQYKIP